MYSLINYKIKRRLEKVEWQVMCVLRRTLYDSAKGVTSYLAPHLSWTRKCG